ncbi:MAG: hypothetical protein ACR2P7_06715, partial [bacterium]
LKANYMDKFKDYLSKEGVKIDQVSITLPVKKIGDVKDLKILKKREDVGRFEYSEVRLDLSGEPEQADKVTLDRYGALQMLESETGAAADGQQKNLEGFERRHLKLMNQQAIYHKVLARKRRCGWHNMTIQRETINALLENQEWYDLYIPPEKLELSAYGRVREWEGLAADLIGEYADRFWRKARNRWEHEHMEVAPLDDENSNYIKKYELLIDAKQEELIEKIEELADQVADGDYEDFFQHQEVQMSLFKHSFQTYHPLLHIAERREPVVHAIPVALKDGEAKFVDELKKIATTMENSEHLHGKEIYLMRNQSRNKGISFFDDHAFYPDFILWVKHPDKTQQDILFIDPKGLSRYDHKVERKANLHKRIKDTQSKLQKKHPQVFLHAYIWTDTRPQKIGTDKPMTAQDFKEKGIYFASGSQYDLRALLEHALA